MATIGKLTVEIGAVFRGLDEALKGLDRRLAQFGRKFQRLGSDLTQSVSLPLAAAGAAASRFAGSFDQAMTRSVAIMGSAGREMRGEMERLAMDLSERSRFSAAQIAESYYYLASAGMSVEQSMSALPAVIEFATAGAFDLSRATTLLAGSQSTLGLKTADAAENLENMTRVSDQLVKVATLADASVEEFAEALGNRAGAALRRVNKDSAEGLAVLAAWADQMVKGAEAGTRLDIVLRDIQKAALAARKSGGEFYDAIYDSTGTKRSMVDIAGWLEERLRGLSDVERRAAIDTFGLQEKTVTATLSLLGFSDKIRQWERDIRAAGGTTHEVSEYQLSDFISQMTMIWHRVQNVGIQIGQHLNPVLLEVATLLAEYVVPRAKQLAEWFSNLTEAAKRSVVQWGLWVVALGPVLLIVGKVIAVLGSLIKLLRLLYTVAAAHPLVALSSALAAAAMYFGVFSGAVDEASAAYGRFSGMQSAAKIQADVHRAAIAALEAQMASSREEIVRLEAEYANLARAANEDIAEGWSLAQGIIDPKLRAIEEAIARNQEAVARWQKRIEELRARAPSALDAVARATAAAAAASAEAAGAAEQNTSSWRMQIDLAPSIKGVWDAVAGGVQHASAALADMHERYLKSAGHALTQWAEDVAVTTGKIAERALSFVDETIGSISRGIGNTFAQALVYGESFSKAFGQMWMQVAAQAISSLVAMGIQMLIYWAISRTVLGGLLVSNASTAGGRAYAGGVASVWETVPWFIALGLAPAMGAVALSQALGGIAMAAFAEGGLALGPLIGLVGEAGPELVLPLNRVDDLLGGQHAINLYLDGEVIARRVVRRLPAVLDVDLGLGGIL